MHSGSRLEDAPGPLEGYSVSRLSVCRPSTRVPRRGQQCNGRLRWRMGSCGVQVLMNGFSALMQGPHGTPSPLLLHEVTVSRPLGTRKRLPPEPGHAGILPMPAPRCPTVKNKCLLLVSPPACHVSSWGWPKTIPDPVLPTTGIGGPACPGGRLGCHGACTPFSTPYFGHVSVERVTFTKLVWVTVKIHIPFANYVKL